MSMKLFSFYLDNNTKEKAQSLLPETEKGSLAPLIRLLLRMYAEGQIEISSADIQKEYVYTSKKNKRSKL